LFYVVVVVVVVMREIREMREIRTRPWMINESSLLD
jgi:hypothetical protein